MLVDGGDGAVAGVGEWAGGEDGVGGVGDVEGGAVDVYEVDTSAFGLFLVLFFVVLVSAHEGVVVSAFGLFGVAVDDAGDFFVEDAVVDVGFFGVEVFVEGGAYDAVGVDGDAEFFGGFADVGVVPGWGGSYFLYPPSWEKTRRLPPFYTYFLRSSSSVGVKMSLGAAMMKRLAFFIF